MIIQKFADVPGIAPARVDVSKIVCVRVERVEEGAYVILHTSEGFAFAAIPPKEQPIEEFYQEVVSAIWPPTPKRTTKATTK